MDKRLLNENEKARIGGEFQQGENKKYGLIRLIEMTESALLAKADKAKLDRPELEKAIKEIFCRQCDGISHAETCDLDKAKCPVLQTAPAQLLALMPDEEEIAEQVDALRGEMTKLNKKLDDREADLLEAKREERKRILDFLESSETDPHKKFAQIWQALKEGK